MDTLLTESMISGSLLSGLKFWASSGKLLQDLRGITAKNGAQLVLIEYHAPE
jgi:hypothetical protein